MTGDAGKQPADAMLRVSGGARGDGGRSTRAARPPRSARDEAGYERWLAETTERLDPVMALLGVVFLLLAAFELADPGLSRFWERALAIATWAIWAVFVVDFAAKLVAAPSTTRFLRRHWLAVLMLLVPALRILRFGALLRVGRALPAARVFSTSYRATGVARGLLGSRTAYLAASAAVMTLALAQLAWLAERGRSTFDSFGDSLLWSASTVLAMQGDPIPESAAGRLVMLAGFAVGLVLIAALAGTVGAYLLEDRRERAERSA